jgi:hypothetical protein
MVFALDAGPAAADGARRLAQAGPAARPAPQQPHRAARPSDLRAATSECAWVGKRAVRVLMRDDLIAAEGFLKFYSAFGCPTRHLGQAFGCAVSSSDSGSAREVETRIEACWADPAQKATAAPRAPAPPPAAKPAPPPAGAKPKAPPPAPSRDPAATTYPKR